MNRTLDCSGEELMRGENCSVTVENVLRCAFALGVFQTHKEGLRVLLFVSHSRSHQPFEIFTLTQAPAHTGLAFKVGGAGCRKVIATSDLS
jgi:hypothetical protein